MKKILGIALFIALVCLQSCSKDNEKPTNQIITIEPHSVSNSLYYAGTIQPSKTMVVTSPADGVILDMPFQYGDQMKMGDRLFVISSAKFLSDYKTALMAYIKGKNDFNTAQAQLSESKFLHKNLLISDDDYKTKQTAFYGSQLALIQARDSLDIFLNQLNVKNLNLYNLTISDVDKINAAMHLQSSSQNLQILSPIGGIVLSPSKSDDENKKFSKGDAVKQGDVLAVLGEMNSLSVSIKVNEMVVNLLKPGQKVKITGMAFPDYPLDGEISSVDRQGEGSSSGMPTFTALVTVPKITLAQQQEIHVGMSAKVEIDIQEEPQITVPFSAITQKDGQSYVSLVDAKTKKEKQVVVTTGKTTMDAVRITSGVKPGDQIVVPA